MHIRCTVSAANTKPLAAFRPPGAGGNYIRGSVLAVSSHSAQLARKEMVGRPRSADRHFAVLQLLGGGGVAVLVFFHAFGVDQMGNVNQHALGSDLLAADFFLEWIEQLVDLD